jgi:hypothetical protein
MPASIQTLQWLCSVLTGTALSCLCSTLGSGKNLQAKRVKDAYEFYYENLESARLVSVGLIASRSCTVTHE